MARPLSHMEVLRRAVAEAHRAADIAHTAVWRARRKMDNAVALVATFPSVSSSIRVFLDAEVKRLREQAFKLEDAACNHERESCDLAELMGAKEPSK